MNEGKDGFGGKGEELRDKLADEYGGKQEFGQSGQDESLREKLEQQYDPDQTGSGAKGEDDSPFFGKGEGKEGPGGSQWGEEKFGGSKGQFGSGSEGDSPESEKGGFEGNKGGFDGGKGGGRN